MAKKKVGIGNELGIPKPTKVNITPDLDFPTNIDTCFFKVPELFDAMTDGINLKEPFKKGGFKK